MNALATLVVDTLEVNIFFKKREFLDQKAVLKPYFSMVTQMNNNIDFTFPSSLLKGRAKAARTRGR